MVGSFLKGGSFMQWKSLHEKALLASQKFKHSEAELLAVLVEIDTHRVFEKFGVTSTYSYCLKILRLSEDQAYAFVKVARLSQQMPALQGTSGAKAENTTKTQSDRKRIPLPAKLKQAVQLRNQGQCTFEHYHFGRCQSRRWLEIHHKVPVSRGGENTLSNLQTL